MKKERNEKGIEISRQAIIGGFGPVAVARADGRPDLHGFNTVQLIQLTTDVTTNERTAEK